MNITPDKETGIGGWTEEMFINRFRVYNADSGYVHMDVGEGYNTIMPWAVYSKMDEYGFKAIYAYLMSLNPIKSETYIYQPKTPER